MKLLLAAFFATMVVATSSGGAVQAPSAPVNLATSNITEDSITVTWGPSEPGLFSVLPGATRRVVPVAWVPSQDDTGIASYTVLKNNSQVATVTAPSYTFSVNRHTTSFRVCVQATNNAAQPSTSDCGTISR